MAKLIPVGDVQEDVQANAGSAEESSDVPVSNTKTSVGNDQNKEKAETQKSAKTGDETNGTAAAVAMAAAMAALAAWKRRK